MRMSPLLLRPRSVSFSSHALIEPLEARIAPAAVFWKNDADGLWTDAANWSGGVVPGPNDDVTIDRPNGVFTITLPSGDQSVHSLISAENLSITGGTLTLAATSSISGHLELSSTLTANADLDLTGTVAWNSGSTLAGTGPVTSHGMVTLAPHGTSLNTVFHNAGTLNVGTGSFFINGQLDNASGGTLNLSGDESLNGRGTVAGDGSAPLTNEGTINVLSGTQLSFAAVVNTGTLHVLAGNFTFRNDSTSSGIFKVEDGGQMSFVAGTGIGVNHITAGAQWLGEGLYVVDGFGTVDIAPDESLTVKQLSILGFSGVGGAGNLTIPSGGLLTMNNGTLYGTGKTTVAAGAVMNVINSKLEDHALDLSGTMNSSGGPGFNLHEQSTMNVLAGAVVNLTGGNLTGSAGSLLTIAGTINASNPGGSTSLSASVISLTGTIHATAGALQVSGTMNSMGTFDADAGTSLQLINFFGSRETMFAGTQWNGTGQYILSSTVAIDAGVSLTQTNVLLTGTLAGAGTLTIASGGTLSVPDNDYVSMVDAGTLNISAGATFNGFRPTLSDGRVINNDGLINVYALGTNGLAGGTINNHAGATFHVVSPMPGNQSGSVSGFALVFNNQGTLTLESAGVNGASFYGELNNSGLVQVNGGIGNVQSATGSVAINTGEYRANAGSSFHYSTPIAFSAGAQLAGPGTHEFFLGLSVGSGLDLHPDHLILHDLVNGPGTLTARSGADWTLSLATLNNLGDLTIQSGAKVLLNGELDLTNSSIHNSGRIDVAFGDRKLITSDATTVFTNEATGEIHLDDLRQNSAAFGTGGSLLNHGLISHGGTSTALLTFGFSTFSNDGTLEVAAGAVQVTGAVAQVSGDGTVLTGGTWVVRNGASLQLSQIVTQDYYGYPLVTIVDNHSNVTLSGIGAKFNALDDLATNSGSLHLLAGARAFNSLFFIGEGDGNPGGNRPGPLTNTGALEIGIGSLFFVTGDFTQTSQGSLTLHLQGAAASDQYGQLVVVGAASLGGALELIVDGAAPKFGDTFPLITYASATGDFATKSGVSPLLIATLHPTEYDFVPQSVPSDLAPLAFNVSGTATAGGNVTVTFTVKNTSAVPTNAGAWTDLVYVSLSPVFDSSAKLLGSVAHSGALAGGASYQDSLTAAVPGLLPGDYHVFVFADASNQVAETDNANNLLAGAGVVHVDLPVLTLGTAQPITLASGHDLYYQVNLPAGADRISLNTSAVGGAELYLAKGFLPSPSQSIGYAFDPTATTQTLEVPGAEGGVYYVLVHPREGAGVGVSATLTASALPFAVSDVGPAASTNNAATTLTVHGAQFNAATSFALVPHGGGTAQMPTHVIVQDSGTAYLTFDLHGDTPGAYDVTAANAGTTVTLASGFQVLPTLALEPELQISFNISAPANIRTGRAGDVLISYYNPTTHDLAAPLLIFQASNATILDGTGDDQEMYVHFIEFYATNTGGGPVGTLPGGYHGSRSFQFQPENAAVGTVTNLSLQAVDPKATIDDGKLQIEAREAGVLSDADWALVDAQLKIQLGPLYGHYQDVLRNDIALLPATLGDARSPISLLKVELLKAEAAVFTSITGTLGAAPAGVATAGAHVFARNTDTGDIFATEALNDGSFIFGQVTPGHYTFTFENAVVTNAAPVIVAAQAHVAGVSLGLAPGAQLTGVLSDAAGVLPGSSVLATRADGTTFTTVADETGHYRFGALPTGTYSLLANASGHARLLATNVPLTLGSNSFDFTLTPGATLTGHVTPRAGGPAGTAVVNAVSLTDDTLDSFHVPADAQGNYTLTGLPAGTYQVTVAENGYVSTVRDPVVVTAGQTLSLSDTALVVAGTISGTVSGEAPAMAHLVVGAYVGGNLVGTSSLDGAGHFSITGLAPGSYTVQAVGGPAFGTTVSFALAEGATHGGVVLDEHLGGTIAGTVHNSSNAQALAGVAVTATGPGGVVLTTHTDSAGHYEFDGLGLGAYTLQLPLGGTGSTASATVSTLSSSLTSDLTTAIAAHLSGHLKLDDGTPVSYGTVELLQGGKVVAEVTTGPDGAYGFSLVNAGTYSLRADAPTATFAETSAFTLAAGSESTHDLSSGLGTLTVHVTDSTAAVAGADLVLYDLTTGKAVTTVTVAADGSASFSHLAPGNYRVFVANAGNRGAIGMVTVGASGTTDLPLALGAQASLTGHVTGLAAGAQVVITAYSRSTPGLTFNTVAAADGSYSFTNLPVDNYDIIGTTATRQAAQASNMAVSGNTNFDVAFATLGTLVDGVVKDSNGVILANATVQFLDASGKLLGQTTADASGNYSLRLPGGPVTVRVIPPSAPQFDFVGLQVNEPTPMDVPQQINLNLLSQSVLIDLSGFDFYKALIDNLPYAKLDKAIQLFDTVIQLTGQWKDDKSKDHVDSLPGIDCPGCQDEYAAASRALGPQDTFYRFFSSDYSQLVQASVKGTKLIQDEAYKNLNTLISIASLGSGLGALFAEARVAAGLATSAASATTLLSQTADAASTFQGLVSAYAAVLQTAENGFQPSDDPDQTVTYLKQLAQGDITVGSFFTSLYSTVTKLTSSVDKIGLGRIGGVLGIADQVLNLESTVNALTYTDSISKAEEVSKDFKLYQSDHDKYDEAAKTAREKLNKLEDCMKNNAANPACNPNPKPGKPGNTPLPGGGAQSSSHSGTGGSFDPNDIVGPAGSGEAGFIGVTQTLPFLIHFQNLSTATAPAAEVVITEQLDSHLDYSSFRLGTFTFGDFSVSIPAGRSSYSTQVEARASLGVFVNFSASVNTQTGLVTWDLKAIDPATGAIPSDASLGFLPPDDAGHHGEGSVSYTVQPKAGGHTGDVISARASIVFDANVPISTATISNTLDAVAPSSAVQALPSQSGPDLTVRWTGATDDPGGSGIHHYDVFVSKDGGSFQPFVLGTTHTAAIFTGEAGHSYQFYSLATDAAGNVETVPASSDASVSIVAGATLAQVDAHHPLTLLGPDGKSFTIALTGLDTATVSLINGVANHADIRAITLSGNDPTSTLKITSSRGAPLQVGRIDSGGLGFGAVTLGAGVVLGDGFDDGATDLHIGGALRALSLGDVNNYAIVQVGDQLTTGLAASARALPVTVGNVLGDGVEMSFFTKLGAVKAQSWAYGGSLQSSLGAASLTVLHGDFNAAVDVLAGNLGPVSIPGGGLHDGIFKVAGTLTSLTVKSFLDGPVTVGALGNLSAGGFFGATVLAQTGGIGNITSTERIVSSSFTSAHGKIGNISVQLVKRTDDTNALDNDLFSAQSIGNITAAVSGTATMLSARGIENSTFLASTGNIGAIVGSVTGSKLNDGAGIEGGTFIATLGSIGNLSAMATSGSAAPGLAGLRSTNLSAHGNIGNIRALATATAHNPTGGSVTAVQDLGAGLTISAEGSIAGFFAQASGSGNAAAVGILEGQRLSVHAGGALGPVTLIANAAPRHTAFAVSRADFFAGTTMGAVNVSGKATSTQVFDTSFIAGGRIAGVHVSAIDGTDGILNQTTIIAGASHPLAALSDLTASGLGPVTVSGSLLDSRIAAAGNLGAITIGGVATGSLILAGDQAGADGELLTGDDAFFRAASIASLKVGGVFSGTTVAAGINPGANHLFGDADDAAASAVAALVAVRGKIGPITLGAATVAAGATTPFASPAALNHLAAIESLGLTAISIGRFPLFRDFTTPVYLDANGDHVEQGEEELIRVLGV